MNEVGPKMWRIVVRDRHDYNVSHSVLGTVSQSVSQSVHADVNGQSVGQRLNLNTLANSKQCTKSKHDACTNSKQRILIPNKFTKSKQRILPSFMISVGARRAPTSA